MRLRVLYLAVALDDAADHVRFFADALEDALNLLEFLGRDHQQHADTHVEGAHHLRGFNVAEFPQMLEDRQDGPCPHFDERAGSFGQHAGQIFGHASAGDVGHGADGIGFDEAAKNRPVTAMLLHQFVADLALDLVDVGLGRVPGNGKQQFAGERIAVRVQSVGRQTQ